MKFLRDIFLLPLDLLVWLGFWIAAISSPKSECNTCQRIGERLYKNTKSISQGGSISDQCPTCGATHNAGRF